MSLKTNGGSPGILCWGEAVPSGIDPNIAALGARIGGLMERTDNMRTFGIRDGWANGINTVGKFSAVAAGLAVFVFFSYRGSLIIRILQKT